MAKSTSGSWQGFVESYVKMTDGERQQAVSSLSTEQRAHLATLLGQESVSSAPATGSVGSASKPRSAAAVRFADFGAQQLALPGLFSTGEYEGLDQVMAKMNAWIDQYEVAVISIETVVLPNMYRSNEEGSEDVSLSSSGEYSTTWHQFFRLWYMA